MAGTTVEPSKTTHGEITLDLSAPAVGQQDGQKGGGVGEGGDTG